MWPWMTQRLELNWWREGRHVSSWYVTASGFNSSFQKRTWACISVCVCVFVELRGGVRRAVNTHLVAWSEPRTQANQSWVTGSFQKHNNRDWNTGVGPHWGVETQTLTRAFVHSLPPEVCPRLGVPTRTPSPPPRPQACWGCTCWKCRSWACVFAVSERWTSRYIKNWRTLKSWKTI